MLPNGGARLLVPIIGSSPDISLGQCVPRVPFVPSFRPPKIQALSWIFHSCLGSRGQNRRSAGFSRCHRDWIADFPIGRASELCGVSGFGNPRYSRLGSLRYGIAYEISGLKPTHAAILVSQKHQEASLNPEIRQHIAQTIDNLNQFRVGLLESFHG